MSDFLQVLTQAEFGELVGISQQAVSDLQAREVLRPGGTAGAWLSAYCSHLREVAAGRGSLAGGPDLVRERAELARVQRERIELQNAITRGEQAPIELLGDALVKSIEVMVTELEQIDGLLAQTVPDLPDAARRVVLSCVAAARNKIASRGAQLVMEAIAPGDDIDLVEEGDGE